MWTYNYGSKGQNTGHAHWMEVSRYERVSCHEVSSNFLEWKREGGRALNFPIGSPLGCEWFMFVPATGSDPEF